MKLMNEITHAFDHISNQLTLIGLRVKVSKCKFWNPSKISLSIEFLQSYTFVIDGLCLLCVPMGSQNFAMHFLDDILFYDMVHIIYHVLLGDSQVALGILLSCVAH
jgi:hypothetical protein